MLPDHRQLSLQPHCLPDACTLVSGSNAQYFSEMVTALWSRPSYYYLAPPYAMPYSVRLMTGRRADSTASYGAAVFLVGVSKSAKPV